MCNCVTQIENEQKKKLSDLLKEKNKLTLRDVKLVNIVFGLKDGKNGKAEMWMKTASTLELDVEERKRPIKQAIVHNYCPFCGQKY